jgi:hypothetical protein
LELEKDADISTAWIIEPLEERVETLAKRQEEERRLYPWVGHLDRFV